MQQTGQRSTELIQFGKYLLDEEIARGGMARVYRARLRGVGGFEKRLVVKQVLPELASDPRFVEMFVEEAKTLVQMSHPNVVPVYELGIVDGVYFLAMEHVEGATLSEILKTRPLGPALAAHVGFQVCGALSYAHVRFGLVHRDVTPRNIIVDASGHVRLFDFGIAAPAAGTGTGEVFGSHGYMSPEQLRGDVLDPRSDLFSLGAVLFESVTGQPAFLRESVELTRSAVLSEAPPAADESDFPAGLSKVVDELLETEPQDRPESAASVGKRLRSWLSAARPEGVAHELGERAEAARARASEMADEHTEGTAKIPRTKNHAVKTIATNVVLQQVLKQPSQPAAMIIPQTAQIRGRRRDGREAAAQRGMLVALAIIACVAALLGLKAWASEDNVQSIGVRPVYPTVLAPPGKQIPLAHPPVEPPTPTADAGRPRAPVEQSSTLSINAVPWAYVRLDGRSLGTTPRRNLDLPAGTHSIELECPPLGRSARVTFRAEAAGRATLTVDMNVDPPTVTWR
jgi:serine/threonine-protein kinase